MVTSKSLATCISLIVTTLPSIVTASPDLGGFIEEAGTASIRPILSNDVIQSFMPQRGPFTFPSPYNTQAFRLTNSSNCAGQDCVNYAGYSYWRNMNNHVGMDSMLIFIGLNQSRGGTGPSLFELNKNSGEVKDLGALFPSSSPLSWATGEGWYFSATMPTKLYINDGPRIVRFDVISEQMHTVADVTDELGDGYILWQMHSSDDDRVHSATVRDAASYQMLGCMAYEEDSQRYHYFPFERDFDECQVDRSGEWLVIKADLDGRNGEDNLIINLKTGHERVLLDEDGAAGHSDVGHGYMIAADNWANDANTWKLWDFNQSVLQGQRVYRNNDWTVAAPNHLSHTNARPGVAARDQYACASSVNRSVGPHANEIICFNLDGSESTLVVAPVMTDLNASGGGDNYAKAPKGNLDVTGRYFFWTSNTGGSRLDAFVVRVPDHLLANSAPVSPVPDTGTSEPDIVHPPMPDVAAPDDTTTDGSGMWHETRNVTVAGNSLSKTSGCHGCPDAGAISAKSVTHGSASFEFTADASGPMLSAGLTSEQSVGNGKEPEYSVRLQQGSAEVRERGVYRADVAFAAGDRFTIAVADGQVKYLRNGSVFHTSTLALQYPLFAGVTLYDTGATLNDVQFTDGTGSPVGKVETAEPVAPVPDDMTSDDSILWHDTRNVTVADNSLSKTSGCHGCSDAGAVSAHSVAFGAASFNFTADASAPLLSAGLTREQTIRQEPEFSVRLQQGVAEVRERGIYRADVAFVAGDKFTIAVNDGQVTYLRNGTVFHVGTSAAQSPLFAGVRLNDIGATLNDIRFTNADGSLVGETATPDPVVELPPAPVDTGSDGPIVWYDTRNVAIEGDSVRKTSRCNGCADSGAVSVQSSTGTASLNFTADATDHLLYAGLKTQQSDATDNNFNFSIRLQKGVAEIRERGVYRADIRFSAEDRFAIVVDGGQVKYLHNGAVFHTSAVTAHDPLFAGVTFSSRNAKVNNIRFIVE